MAIAQAGRGRWANPRKRHIAGKAAWPGAVLQAVGAVSLVGIAAACGFAAMIAYGGYALDGESRQFADAAIADIGRDWDERVLESHAAPELLQTSSPQQRKSALLYFSQLGHLTDYGAPKGEATIAIRNGVSTITARYSAVAQFQNGAATVSLGLVKEGGQWMIASLQVRSIGTLRPAATRALQARAA
jgi:hypothetical protein